MFGFNTCGEASESRFAADGLQLGSGLKSGCVYGSVLFVIAGCWYVLGVTVDGFNVSSLGSNTLCYRKCWPVLLYCLNIANSGLPFWSAVLIYWLVSGEFPANYWSVWYALGVGLNSWPVLAKVSIGFSLSLRRTMTWSSSARVLLLISGTSSSSAEEFSAIFYFVIVSGRARESNSPISGALLWLLGTHLSL